MKLKESIPSNSVKIIELYNKITSEILNTRPGFQRKLVWKKQHKFHFIETILLNFPFPEVYIASAEIDIETLTAKEIVVDGQQRLTTIVDYIKGINDFANQKKIPPFEKLLNEEKKDFLNYLVTVKDLKDMNSDIIREIFQRINNTEYSLNAVEKINAEYGDGEFVIFCKQIVDPTFNPLPEDTDVIINSVIKEDLNVFFNSYNIFSDNDKSRMLDVQFIMLVVATILNQTYFSRTTALNKYLEKYNSTFSDSDEILSKLSKAVRIIKQLALAKNSYWFYKANLFILLVEFANLEESNIQYSTLESSLLELEKKADIYFNDDDDISMITEDERKYFEVARQGSNELGAREHRGKVIREIVSNSLKTSAVFEGANVEQNLHYLRAKGEDFAIIKPTETGLRKSIMDAVSSVRYFLKRNNIHDYDNQEFGPDNKVIKEGKFIDGTGDHRTTNISFYRSNNRGDCRIWFTELNSFANASDELALLNLNGAIAILNLSRYNYTSVFN